MTTYQELLSSRLLDVFQLDDGGLAVRTRWSADGDVAFQYLDEDGDAEPDQQSARQIHDIGAIRKLVPEGGVSIAYRGPNPDPISDERIRDAIETLNHLKGTGTFIQRDGVEDPVWSVALLEQAIGLKGKLRQAEQAVREAWDEVRKNGETFEQADNRGSTTLKLTRLAVRKAMGL